MEHVFWLIDNELCGRPGPNHIPWQPQQFASVGIGAVLSVNQAEDVDAQALAKHGIAHKCVPLAAHAPPEPGELELCLERLPEAYAFCREHNEGDQAVLVHCRHGKDRTGLFMAYYLMQRQQLNADAAIAQVKTVRSIAMTAEGWDMFVPEVLSRI